MSIKQLQGLVKSAKYGRLFGGPFREIASHPEVQSGDVTIRLAAELHQLRSTISIETDDFNVPPCEQDVKYSMMTATLAIADGYDVYCGCMGGVGRTGTFMALMVAALNTGVKDPVAFVRANYNGHAVETPLQAAYVAGFIRRHQEFFRQLRSILRGRLQLTAKPERKAKRSAKIGVLQPVENTRKSA